MLPFSYDPFLGLLHTSPTCSWYYSCKIKLIHSLKDLRHWFLMFTPAANHTSVYLKKNVCQRSFFLSGPYGADENCAFQSYKYSLSLATCLPATPSNTYYRWRRREDKESNKKLPLPCTYQTAICLIEGSLQSGSPLRAELGTGGCVAKCDIVCTLGLIKSKICGKG